MVLSLPFILSTPFASDKRACYFIAEFDVDILDGDHAIGLNKQIYSMTHDAFHHANFI